MPYYIYNRNTGRVRTWTDKEISVLGDEEAAAFHDEYFADFVDCVVSSGVVRRMTQAERDVLAQEQTDREDRITRLRNVLGALETMTPQDVDQWVTANVTDLPGARNLLRIMSQVVVHLWQNRK